MASDLPTLRQQLRQLKELHEAGALNADLYQQSRQSLERRIVDAVMAGEVDLPAVTAPAAQTAVETRRAPARLWLTVGTVVVVLAGAGYWWTGSPGMASAPRGEVASMGGSGAPAADAQGTGAPPHALENDQVQAMVDKLAQRLKDTPNDAEGWAMLARSYAVIGRHADAVPAYKKALALRQDDASLMADYADALAVVNQHQLAGEPMALVKKALGIDPDNLKALSLAGTAAFDQKDYATAVKHWDHIMAVAPADSSFLPQVQANLAEARALGKLPTPPAAPASAVATSRSVSGTVTLAAALRDRVAPTDTVFVFARAAEGPRMPLAILRKQVKDLPLDFKLDDSLAMSPAARLSAYPQVVVGARISKSGNAMPQPGDLSGQTPVTALGASGLKIEISQAVTTP